jgi:hypothetical protein
MDKERLERWRKRYHEASQMGDMFAPDMGELIAEVEFLTKCLEPLIENAGVRMNGNWVELCDGGCVGSTTDTPELAQYLKRGKE